jgi:calcium binding protein 39
MVAEYLEKNYDRVCFAFSLLFNAPLPKHSRQFFGMYSTLINSTNYVTKRQSLKLLGEILLDRANFNVMTRYIANEANLKLIMNLLKDKSKNIQFEAFHVFKVRPSQLDGQ